MQLKLPGLSWFYLSNYTISDLITWALESRRGKKWGSEMWLEKDNRQMLAVKMEEWGHKPEIAEASRRWQPSGDSHQERGDHNPTLQRNEFCQQEGFWRNVLLDFSPGKPTHLDWHLDLSLLRCIPDFCHSELKGNKSVGFWSFWICGKQLRHQAKN